MRQDSDTMDQSNYQLKYKSNEPSILKRSYKCVC